jgi:HlyD family secretion protein
MGYTLFKGYITSSIYFRFTIPENQLDKVKKDRNKYSYPYKNKDIKGIVTTIKQLGAYGNIATAYPDYEMQESLFEIKITFEQRRSKRPDCKTTVTLSL